MNPREPSILSVFIKYAPRIELYADIIKMCVCRCHCHHTLSTIAEHACILFCIINELNSGAAQSDVCKYKFIVTFLHIMQENSPFGPPIVLSTVYITSNHVYITAKAPLSGYVNHFI